MTLIERGAEGFEEAVHGPIFNARKPDRVPAAVLQVASEDDIVAGVRLARERGWQIAVRSGGHSWAAWSVRDDALLIDLGGLDEMTYDPRTELATASPSTRGGTEFVPFLEQYGRMFTGGHCETVGLGGFLLQGGQGWNSRRYGWGCENVVAIDVVTADGALVHADATENSDLFWAVRGSGPGFFGVVTRFYLRTYPAEPMWHDTRVFSLNDLEPMLAFLHDVLPQLDVAVEPVMAATRLGGGGTELLLHTTLTAPDRAAADALLAPIDACPVTPITAERGPTTIVDENIAMTEQNPEGYRYCADSQWTNADAATLAPRLRPIYAELPTKHSFSIWYGWAPTRPLPDMAFSLERNVYLATYAIWDDPADDERYRTWVHDHHRRLSEIGDGVYLGDSDFSRRPDAFVSQAAHDRLEAIRAERDPDGMFAGYLR